MDQTTCPHCGKGLAAVSDAFCPECFGELDRPVSVSGPAARGQICPVDRAAWAGTALIVVGCLNLVVGLLVALGAFTGWFEVENGMLGAASGLAVFGLAAVTICGGFHLANLGSYRWAPAGSVLALALPACCLSLPVAIWAIGTVFRPEMRAAFGDRRSSGEAGQV